MANNCAKTKTVVMDLDNTKKPSRATEGKTVLEKLLLLFVVLLLTAVGFLLYLFVIERQKNGFNPKEYKNLSPDESNTAICTTDSCVLNAAGLLKKMDSTADPCDDFYRYACGGYETTAIPSHLKSIHVLRQLQEENTEFLKTLLENPKFRNHYAKNKPVSKAFHMYDTCMDVNKLDRIGIGPLQKFMKDIGGSNITSKQWDSKKYDGFDAVVQATRRLNFNIFFKIDVLIDPKNGSRHAFSIENADLGKEPTSYLPNKTPQDDKLRQSYKDYMVKMMKSIAAHQSNVEILMQQVYALEKRIAKVYVKYVNQESNPTIGELSNYTKFDWLDFFQKLTAETNYIPSDDDIILVESQEILKHVISIVENTEKRVLSNFIAWKILQGSIPVLPLNYSTIQQKYLNSIQSRFIEQPKRRRTCVKILSNVLKMVLSYLYVDQKFSEQSRERANKVFEEIRQEFIENLKNKTWMDDITKRKAKEKAQGINFLVGYNDDLKNPQKLEDIFHSFRVNRTNFFQTFLNQQSFLFKRNVKKLLNPVHKNAFDEMTSYANAYYSPQENKISFMAGILQKPLYNKHNSRASNYGSLGMFVGHELTHAFDSRGHKYDRNGELRNWWTKSSLENFHNKSKCFVEQYNKFTILGEHVNGAQTLGENIADNGGLKLAYNDVEKQYTYMYHRIPVKWLSNAFKRREQQTDKEQRLPGLNLTNDQIFFLSFAQSWCSKYTIDGVKEIIQFRVPMMFRVTGPLRNSVQFSKAYHCPLGARMNPRKKCNVW